MKQFHSQAYPEVPVEIPEFHHVYFMVNGQRFTVNLNKDGKLDIHTTGQLVVEPNAANWVVVSGGNR